LNLLALPAPPLPSVTMQALTFAWPQGPKTVVVALRATQAEARFELIEDVIKVHTADRERLGFALVEYSDLLSTLAAPSHRWFRFVIWPDRAAHEVSVVFRTA
jgi:hypothetical protein